MLLKEKNAAERIAKQILQKGKSCGREAARIPVHAFLIEKSDLHIKLVGVAVLISYRITFCISRMLLSLR